MARGGREIRRRHPTGNPMNKSLLTIVVLVGIAGLTVVPSARDSDAETIRRMLTRLHDNGEFYEHRKFFVRGNVTAVVEYEPGISVAELPESEPQSIYACRFLPGEWGIDRDIDPGQSLPLSEVDKVVLSEAIRDLAELVARGA